MSYVLKARGISRKVKDFQILNDVSFELKRGEIVGLIGPNGAGKTSIMKVLVGLTKNYTGELDMSAIKDIGSMIETPSFYSYNTGYENLMYFAKLNGVGSKRVEELLELLGLTEAANKKVKAYSLGMRQRLGVAQAILHRPEVLILDEPTNGLDPAGIKGLRNVLIRIAHEENCSVIVSSHLMSEMELMCDRVGIIANGKMLAIKQIDEFKEEAFGNSLKYSVVTADNDKAMQLITSKFDVEAKLSGDGIKVEVSIPKESDVKISGINRALIEDGIDIETVVQEESRSLEDAFIQLTAQEGGNQIA